MHIVHGHLFQFPCDITRARVGAKWASGHICLSKIPRTDGTKWAGGLRRPPNHGNPKYQVTNPESKWKVLEETEVQRGAEACLRPRGQLEAQLGVEHRAEAGLLVQCSLPSPLSCLYYLCNSFLGWRRSRVRE